MLGRTRSEEPRKAYGHAAYGLAERRHTRRRRSLIVFAVLAVLAVGSAIYGLQQNAVRISHIEILGSDPSLSEFATNAMRGSYLGGIPRDSIFFFPEERIRADILASHNDIAAVSILRNGFTVISIKVDYRVPIARWCGDATRFNLEDTDLRLNLAADCYVFDTSGYIYATTTEAQSINSFILYESLVSSTSPIGTTLPNADKLPVAFDFARQLSTFGSHVISVVIRNDEVDNNLANGTRVTYVLGHERDAFTALVSAGDNINLSDGSVDYVDLRFEGKVYLKKK